MTVTVSKRSYCDKSRGSLSVRAESCWSIVGVEECSRGSLITTSTPTAGEGETATRTEVARA